jgi:hypothetical protein
MKSNWLSMWMKNNAHLKLFSAVKEEWDKKGYIKIKREPV